MALDRTWYNTLVDDDGSGVVGSVWDKADVDSLMDAVDSEIARLDTKQTTGAWTPTFSASGGSSGNVYGASQGYWVRMGDWVSVTGYVALTAKGTMSGNLQIGGLPFRGQTLTTAHSAGGAPWFYGFAAAYSSMAVRVDPGQLVIDVYGIKTPAGSMANVPVADVAAGSQIMF